MYTKIIILITFFLSVSLSISSENSFPRGSTFSVKDSSVSTPLLTSIDGTFTCGFYTVGPQYHTNAYWFSIWFTNSKDKTAVWMANRDKPVSRGSTLALKKHGSFLLTDFDGSIAWQTNTTSMDVDRAELLDSGNLVLKDPRGKIIWQSFDSPTHTLLPGQQFHRGYTLVSGLSHHMFGSGYFSLFFDTFNVLRLLYDGPEFSSIYWPGGDSRVFVHNRTSYNNTRVAVLDDMGSFLSSDKLQFNASDMGFGIKRRLTMDYDGNLRLYSLNESSRTWITTWQAMSKLCEVHGLCGKNGVCVYTPEPRCSCPPHYEPKDPMNWSKGCKPKFNRSCKDNQFIELPYVDFYGYDLNYLDVGTFEDCKQHCLSDCQCKAFSYKSYGDVALDRTGMCHTKSVLFNGYMSNDFQGSIYMRVPSSMQTSELVRFNVSHLQCGNGEDKIVVLPSISRNTIQRFKWVYIYSFASAIGAIEIIILLAGWLFLFRTHVTTSLEAGYRAISSQFRKFSYGELETVTSKFKEVIGIGGFGVVYKGMLVDERAVAVKKLGDVRHGEEEFWAEVSIIGKINHMNLTRMWGFCSDRKHRLLVYEYVENGSLDKHLFSNETLLGWKERFKVAIGTAKGLAYLHHECLDWVIHCDVKPENILLDRDFEPKISDFGLAKLCQRSGHGSSESTRIRGTKGYMAPEWAMNVSITSKVDVYSYGVVILELVRGIRLSNRAVDDHPNEEEVSELVRFVRLAKCKIQNGDDLLVGELVDPRLQGRFNNTEAATLIKLGLCCVEEDRNKRPTMESVAQILVECEEGKSFVANISNGH